MSRGIRGGGKVKLEDYSIDDLHQAAIAEFENFPNVLKILNSHYESFLNCHIALIGEIRRGYEEARRDPN